MDNEVNRPSPFGPKPNLTKGAEKSTKNDTPDLISTDDFFAEFNADSLGKTIDALHQVDDSDDAHSFKDTVNHLKELVKTTNNALPQSLKGVSIPRAEILYASRLKEQAPATIIILPEQHITTGINPLVESGGISPYSAKVLNCHLLKEIFADDRLAVQSSLHESSIQMGDDMNFGFEKALDDEKIPAFYYANHLSVAKGTESIPFEDPKEELKFLAQNVTFFSMLFTEAQVPPEKKAFAPYEVPQLMSQFGFRDMNAVGMRMSILVNDMNRILDGNDLPKSELGLIFKEIEDAISPHGYISIDDSNGHPNFDFNVYGSINPKVRRSYFNYLNSLPAAQALVRDEATAKKIKKLKGNYPMIIGAKHVPSIINELEKQGLAVCVIGADSYHGVMDLDIRGSDFKSKIESHKQAVLEQSQAKFKTLRSQIA
jgi:hypothetical protein